MIICHPLKLIFFKTKKTAGTSFEVALSHYCSDACIITPISPDDELQRRRLDCCGPRNFEEKHRLGREEATHLNYNIKGDFANHMTAARIKQQVGQARFDRYCKITIHRDPLDALVSQYFYQQKVHPDRVPDFAQWCATNKEKAVHNFMIAPLSGPNKCDIVLRYESLVDDIKKADCLPTSFLDVFTTLGFKKGYRPDDSRWIHDFYAQHNVDTQEILSLVTPYYR